MGIKHSMCGGSSMKKLYILFIVLFVLACTDSVTTRPDDGRNGQEESLFGWRWDDFVPVPDHSRLYGGLREIFHVGDWIVLRDDYYSSNEYTSPGKITLTPRIFASKIGSTQWDTLSSSEWIRYIYGDSSGLYAGTQLSGKVLKYDFERHMWNEIYALKFDSAGFYSVYGITMYRGWPVVCIAGFEDSTDLRQETIKLFMKMQTDTGWADITYDYDSSKEYPFQFHKGVELNGKLYAISSARGMWRYDGRWKKMARIPHAEWAIWEKQYAYDTSEIIMDIVVHKGKIYVFGEKSSTYVLEYDEAMDMWNPVDSVIATYDDTIDTNAAWVDPYRGQRLYQNTPPYKYSLASDGKHLFVAGEWPSLPAVYMGDYGEPYGIEEKGWRYVDGNWCTTSCMSADGTYDMEVVGDTLYMANWKGLLKFPLADLDSAISNRDPYPSAN